jgi:hypothetical protein
MSETTATQSTPTIEQLQEQLRRDVQGAADQAHRKLMKMHYDASDAIERMESGQTPGYTGSADVFHQTHGDCLEAVARLNQILDYARHFVSPGDIEAAYSAGVARSAF